MKFIIRKASDWDYEKEIELHTLEELMEFMEYCGYSLVIEQDKKTITIYDDWME